MPISYFFSEGQLKNKMRQRVFVLVIILAVFCIAATFISCTREAGSQVPFVEVQNTENESDVRLIKALRSYIPHVVKDKGTPGLNIALARRGKIIWEAGFGFANLEKRTPMTPRTVCHSGSMGKAYTSTAIMQLVEKGVLGIDEPINTYIKDFQITNPFGDREITVKDLLTHSAGLSTNTAHPDFEPPKSLGEHLKFRYSQKNFQPYSETLLPLWSAKVGKVFQYSNLGMATLGYLVEITNPEDLSFSDYVQKYIMNPLGMSSTQYPPVQDAEHVRPDIFERLSTGYARWGAVDIPTPAMYFADYPAGTVVTIPGDHIKLLLAYLNKGTYNDYQLLKPETVKLMLTPQIDAFGGRIKLGLMWLLTNVDELDFNFSHGGAHMYGWNNDFKAYPKLDFAVAVFTNHWSLPVVDRENVLIADFIASWLKNEQKFSGTGESSSSWAWKTSYVIGLLFTEQIKGMLGVKSPLTEDMIEAMVEGAKFRPDDYNSISGLDPDGFRTGAKDMLDTEMTVKGINEFFRSDKIRVTKEELKKIYHELGGTSGSPYFFILEQYLKEK